MDDLLAGLNLRGLLENALESGPVKATRQVEWTPPTVEELGGLLPDYEVQEVIGRGGMGVVYRCRDPQLGRLVAVKLLPPELGGMPGFSARFRREAWALAQLKHENIIHIHSLGATEAGHLYFVMEYVEGTDLARILTEARRRRTEGKAPLLEFMQTLGIIRQICEALQYAHGEGIVHRDIKPANILVTAAGQVKVADFGLARPLEDGTPRSQMTAAGEVLGTADYMAPEQFDSRGGDHRVDIYALGVMLYEMLTGEVPRGAFPLPSRKVPVDERVDDVVLKAMNSEPAERYAEATQITRDLSPLRATAGRPRPWYRSRRPVALTVMVLAGLAGARVLFRGEPVTVLSPPVTEGPPITVSKPAVINPLGMPFLPVPGLPHVLLCQWETRLRDFRTFVEDAGITLPGVRPERREEDPFSPLLTWDAPGYTQQPDQPVVCVRWDMAEAYCQWLTARERAAGRLREGEVYRLPTDREWSLAAGLTEAGDTPWERVKQPPDGFSWGRQWPPPPGWENVSGEERKKIRGVRDAFPDSAPVGSFRMNPHGFYDMGGNVREWGADFLGFPGRDHAARSSGYRSSSQRDLYANRRSGAWRDLGNDTLGFRIVLDRKAPETRSLQGQLEELAAHWPGAPWPPGQGPVFLVTDDMVRVDLTRLPAAPDLAPLAGMPLTEFLCAPAAEGMLDISPLRGMPLRFVSLRGPVRSLTPLSGAPVEWLELSGDGRTAPPDLTPLAEAPVKGLALTRWPVMPDIPQALRRKLRQLILGGAPLTDAAVAAVSGLEVVDISGMEVEHPAQIAGLALARLDPWPEFFRVPDRMSEEGRPGEAVAWLQEAKILLSRKPWFDSEWQRETGGRISLATDPGWRAIQRHRAAGGQGPPPEAVESGGRHYLMVVAPLFALEARRVAARAGGHVVTITSPEEYQFVYATWGTDKKGSVTTHLGAVRDAAGQWRWCTGEPWAYQPWGGRLPDEADMLAVAGAPASGWIAGDFRLAAATVIEWEAADAAAGFTGTWSDPAGHVMILAAGGAVQTADGKRIDGAWWCPWEGSGSAFLQLGGGAGRWGLRAGAGPDELAVVTDDLREFLLRRTGR